MSLKSIVSGCFLSLISSGFINAQITDFDKKTTDIVSLVDSINSLNNHKDFVDDLEKNYYATHNEEKRLRVNEGLKTAFYVKMSKKDFIDQLDSLVFTASKEEMFFYIPEIGTAFEGGVAETKHSVSYSSVVFKYLVSKFDSVETFHFHPYKSSSSIIQKSPSSADINSYIIAYSQALLLNEHITFSGHHQSLGGTTNYYLKKDGLFEKIIKLTKDIKLVNINYGGELFNNYITELNFNIINFLENECIIYSEPLRKNATFFNNLISRKTIIDFDPVGGKENNTFYIEVVPRPNDKNYFSKETGCD